MRFEEQLNEMCLEQRTNNDSKYDVTSVSPATYTVDIGMINVAIM